MYTPVGGSYAVQTLQASDAGTNSFDNNEIFGISLDMASNGALAVGSLIDAGRVYVFNGGGGTYGEIAKISTPGPTNQQFNFGRSGQDTCIGNLGTDMAATCEATFGVP